jgi:hypothetical protein
MYECACVCLLSMYSFSPVAVHVGFVLDKFELGQALLPVHRFSPVGIIPPELYTLSPIIRATDNGLFRARSSHRYCPFPAKDNKRPHKHKCQYIATPDLKEQYRAASTGLIWLRTGIIASFVSTVTDLWVLQNAGNFLTR